MSYGFRSAFTKNDLMKFGDVAVTTNGYTKIGEYQIMAKEQIELGYKQGDQAGAEGRIHIELKDSTNAALTGTVRIVALTPQDMPKNPSILFEARTEALNQSASDRRMQIPFNANNMLLSEDDKYAVMFKPDANGTVAKDKSTILMDITRYLVR